MRSRQDEAARSGGVAEALSRELPLLLLQARRTAALIAHGAHGQRRAGIGETFWEYREPVAGESLRAIDWRRSARSDRLYVREREREAPVRLQLWSDARPSMDWSSQPDLPTKAQRAALIALALGLAARRAGEQALVIGAAMPATSDGALAAALLDAARREPAGWREGPAVIASDGLEPVSAWQARAAAAAQAGARLLVVLVADPAEASFPYKGRIRFEAPGPDRSEGRIGSRISRLVGRAEMARNDYLELRETHLDQVRHALSQHGFPVWRHLTSEKPTPVAQAIARELVGPRSRV